MSGETQTSHNILFIIIIIIISVEQQVETSLNKYLLLLNYFFKPDVTNCLLMIYFIVDIINYYKCLFPISYGIYLS